MMRYPSIPITSSDEESAYYNDSIALYGSWFAAIYDLVTFPLRRLRQRVVRISNVAAGMRVLDVATGTGKQARAFGEVGATVIGVDLSQRMLAIGQRKNRIPSVSFIEADATALPMKDGTFDVSCVSLALHEMPPSVRSRAVAELARVTRLGGTVVVVDFAQPRNRIWRAIVVRVIGFFERDAYPEFVRSDVHALLERAGIHVRQEYGAILDTGRIIIGERTPAA